MAKYALSFFLLWLCQPALVVAESLAAESPHTVQSLDYGMALYEDFQGQSIAALTQLMAADKRGRMNSRDVFPQLLLGNLSLSLGLTKQAEQVFSQFKGDQQFHDPVNFYLGKFYYYQRQPTQAQALLEGLKQLNAEQQQERLYYLASIAMQANRLDLAQDYEGKILKDSIWKAYISHNLALAHAQQQNFKAAHQLWQRLYRQDNKNAELTLLQQRARLAEGLIYLQQNQLEDAQKMLQALPQSTPWLAGAVLALAASETDAEQAQQQLNWLQSLPGHDYEKSQGLQLSAQLAEQQKNKALAWQRYQSGLSAYQQQQNQLHEFLGGGFDALYQQWLTQRTPDALSSLFETDSMLNQQRQQGVQLAQLQASLTKNAQRLPELQEMLATRQQAHQQRLNVVSLQDLQTRQQTLKTQYAVLDNAALSGQQPWQWASPSLLAQQQKWQRAQQMWQNNQTQFADGTQLNTRLLRIKGALLWQLQEQSISDKLLVKNARREIQTALDHNQQQIAKVQQLLTQAPDYLQLSQRVRDYQQQITRTQQQLQQLQTQFQQQTQVRLHQLLQQQQQVLKTHIADLHYALARLSEAL